MEESISADFLPVYLVSSLQTIAATRVCINLYIRDDLINFLAQQPNLFSIDLLWPEQNIGVKHLVNSFNLPPRLKNKVFNLSISIDDEMYSWIQSNDWIKYRPDYGKPNLGTYKLALFDYFQNCLVWTSRGTVHYEITARNILHSEFVTKEEQFHLACDYCFQDFLNDYFVPTLSQHAPSFDMRMLKPWVYYWICRFFPRRISELTNEEGLRARQNIDKRMFTVAKNDVALRHIFDRLDLMAKEDIIMSIINFCDFEMKYYLLSQLSFGTRENVLRRNSDKLVLNELTNILWQDYVLYHFNTYGLLMTSRQVIGILHELLPLDQPSAGINDRDSRELFINDLWSCLSKNVREKFIVKLLKNSFMWQNGDNSPLPQILAVLLNFKNDDLIKEFLMMVENETIKLEVKSVDSSSAGSFSMDSESYKDTQYYPKPEQKPAEYSEVINNRLHLIHELITAKFLNINPLTFEQIRNDVIDVFVEYCRFGQVTYISTIVDNFFPREEEKISYKLSIFHSMFSKLLKKAVDESYYGLIYTSTGRQIPSFNFQIPVKKKLSSTKFKLRDPFSHNNHRKQINAHLDRRVRSSRRQQLSKTLIFNREEVFIRRQVHHRRLLYNLHPQPTRSSQQLVIYNSDDNPIQFSAVDSFLNWYFSLTEQVNEFKTNMIFNERVPMVVTLLKENRTLKLQKLLHWFLCYDNEKFIAFKTTCPKNELTSFV